MLVVRICPRVGLIGQEAAGSSRSRQRLHDNAELVLRRVDDVAEVEGGGSIWGLRCFFSPRNFINVLYDGVVLLCVESGTSRTRAGKPREGQRCLPDSGPWPVAQVFVGPQTELTACLDKK